MSEIAIDRGLVGEEREPPPAEKPRPAMDERLETSLHARHADSLHGGPDMAPKPPTHRPRESRRATALPGRDERWGLGGHVGAHVNVTMPSVATRTRYARLSTERPNPASLDLDRLGARQIARL